MIKLGSQLTGDTITICDCKIHYLIRISKYKRIEGNEIFHRVSVKRDSFEVEFYDNILDVDKAIDKFNALQKVYLGRIKKPFDYRNFKD